MTDLAITENTVRFGPCSLCETSHVLLADGSNCCVCRPGGSGWHLARCPHSTPDNTVKPYTCEELKALERPHDNRHYPANYVIHKNVYNRLCATAALVEATDG